jgi:hypothetical protein
MLTHFLAVTIEILKTIQMSFVIRNVFAVGVRANQSLDSSRMADTGLALSKRPNRVGFSLPSFEEGNRPSFRNVVLFRIPEDGQSPETQ